MAQSGSAVRRAFDWLAERHRRAVETALAEIHARFDERIGAVADALPDHEQARSEGRPPVDYGFLWRAVGLERPGT